MAQPTLLPAQETAPRKSAGGDCYISIRKIALVWWCYRRGLIRIADLRVWLACHELVARRCRLAAGQHPHYNLSELRGLTGIREKRLKASLKRLGAAGLLDWAEEAIGFGAGPLDPEDPAFAAFLGRFPNNGRLLPVPRRVLRLMAGGARASLIATILGHLVHGLYVRGKRLMASGRVKTSWIAEAFDVDHRRVKEARRELVVLGWLVVEPAAQWSLNRFGGAFRINLAWSRLDGVDRGPKSPPPPAVPGPKLPPPDSDREPLAGEKHQKPAPGGPAGVSPSQGSGEPSAALPEPDLRNVRVEDLRDTGRVLALYDQAIARGLVGSSEADRLNVVAAAEHARVIGRQNPPGLFVRLVRSKLWHYLTQDDEDSARRRLNAHFYGPPLVAPKPLRPSRLRHSDDAILVAAVLETFATQRLRCDPFPMVRREYPDWTRERWDAAVAELRGQSVR